MCFSFNKKQNKTKQNTKKPSKQKTSKLPCSEEPTGWNNAPMEKRSCKPTAGVFVAIKWACFCCLLFHHSLCRSPPSVRQFSMSVSHIVVSLYICYLLILTMSQWEVDYYLQCTDERMEAQGSELNCLKHTANKWINQIMHWAMERKKMNKMSYFWSTRNSQSRRER